MTKPWYSVDEVAKHLGIVEDSNRGWIENRNLLLQHMDNRWKLKLSEFDGSIRRQDRNGKSAEPARVDSGAVVNFRRQGCV